MKKKKAIKGLLIVAAGAVVTLSVVQYATVRKIQKDVETMKNIINDLQ